MEVVTHDAAQWPHCHKKLDQGGFIDLTDVKMNMPPFKTKRQVKRPCLRLKTENIVFENIIDRDCAFLFSLGRSTGLASIIKINLDEPVFVFLFPVRSHYIPTGSFVSASIRHAPQALRHQQAQHPKAQWQQSHQHHMPQSLFAS